VKMHEQGHLDIGPGAPDAGHSAYPMLPIRQQVPQCGQSVAALW
jgi:hypothetical protein